MIAVKYEQPVPYDLNARPLPQNRRIARAQSDPSANADSATSATSERGPKQPGRFRRFIRFVTPGEGFFSIVRAVAGVTLFFGIVISVSWGLYRYISKSPRFAIRSVETEGNLRRSKEDIARLGGIEQGANVFSLDLENAQQSIVRDPWIRSAKVARKLPGTIHVSVVEREATALVSVDGDLYLASHGGELFKRVEQGDPIDFPVITGLHADAGRTANVANIRRAQDVLVEYERTPLGKKLPLQEVHLTDEGGVTLLAGRDSTMLVLGKGPYRLKLERAAKVVSETERRKGQLATIFLDNEAHPEKVVARLR